MGASAEKEKIRKANYDAKRTKRQRDTDYANRLLSNCWQSPAGRDLQKTMTTRNDPQGCDQLGQQKPKNAPVVRGRRHQQSRGERYAAALASGNLPSNPESRRLIERFMR